MRPCQLQGLVFLFKNKLKSPNLCLIGECHEGFSLLVTNLLPVSSGKYSAESAAQRGVFMHVVRIYCRAMLRMGVVRLRKCCYLCLVEGIVPETDIRKCFRTVLNRKCGSFQVVRTTNSTLHFVWMYARRLRCAPTSV